MKKFILPLLLVILVSCGKKTPLQKIINEADVIKIYIYNSDGVPYVYYGVNDIDKIQKFSDYISEKNVSPDLCSHEGRMIFKFSEDSLVMRFSMLPNCHQVNYVYGDTSYTKEITPEGMTFLNSLKEASIQVN